MTIQKILTLSAEYERLHREEEKKIPYSINLLKNVEKFLETAHRNFLWDILCFEKGGKYILLESFIKECIGFQLDINRPKIKKEEEHIDLLVLDNLETGYKYAVLIEIKFSKNERDSPGQLKNYFINISNKYPEREPFVVYISKKGRSPKNGSWTKNDRERYMDRYAEVNYKNNILPWLIKSLHLLKNVETNEIYLISAIDHYIEYLKLLFYPKHVEGKMKDELRNLLTQSLKLNGSPNEDIRVIGDTIKSLKKTEKHLKEMINNLKQDQIRQKEKLPRLFNDWRIRLEESVQNDIIVTNVQNNKLPVKGWPKIGMKFIHKGIKFVCVIEVNPNNIEKPIVGISRHFASSERIEPIIKQFINKIIPNPSTNVLLDETKYYWGEHSTSSDAYLKFINLCEEINKYCQ